MSAKLVDENENIRRIIAVDVINVGNIIFYISSNVPPVGVSSRSENFFYLKFGKLKILTLHLHQFFTTSLIKKGRGKWPCEALATSPANNGKLVLTPSHNRVVDKSDAIVYIKQPS